MHEEKSDSFYTNNFLVENIPNLLCIKDGKGRWLQASTSYLNYFNLQDIDYAGKTNLELCQYTESHFEALRIGAKQDKHAWESRRQKKTEKVLHHRNGKLESFEFISNPAFDQQGNPLRLFITGRIVSKSEKESSEQSFFASIYKCRHINIVVIDQKLQIVHINDAAAALTGYTSSEAKGHILSLLFANDKKINFKSILNFNFSENSSWEYDVLCRKTRKSNKSLPVKLSVSPIPGETEKINHYCVTLLDISEQILNQKRITQIALYDDLTGLGNRVMFFDNLNKFISAASRHKLYAMLFFIDLDNFKSVNDSLGHDAGDELLKEVANRLKSIVRNHDIVARFSGNEFAILMLNEKSHEKAIYEASMVAKKIIEKLSEMFYISNQQIFIGCSIGITLFPEDGLNCEGLLKNADLAMYEAKNKGRNNYQFYKKEYTTAINDKLTLENHLRSALANNELSLFYQPQYRARSRDLWGAEVLVRWFRESDGKTNMIPPDQFIPIAEESGLIIEIGQWILEQACIQHKNWLDKGYTLNRVSVNISARQFIDNGFVQIVVDALNKAKLPPNRLELEITESMLIGDIKLIELKLKRLKSYGVSIALDDFGTGYSSLSYLKSFPIDILKIDQSFIREMTVGSKDARIAIAIIEMGHSLGQKIVAEGVENETQLKLLTKRKCDIIQGYYFSRPLPAPKMEDLLREAVKVS